MVIDAPRWFWRLWLPALCSALALTTPLARAQFGTAPVEVSSVTSRSELRPGDQAVIAVIFDHADRWHIHTNDPKPPKEWGLSAFATVVDPQPAPGLRFGPIQWPKSTQVRIDLGGTGVPLPYDVFEGKAIAYIPVIVDNSAPAGDLAVRIKLIYQACNDRTCALPQDVEQTVAFKIVPAASAQPSAAPDPETFAAFDSKIFDQMLAGTAPSDTSALAKADTVFNVFGYTLTLRADNAFFLLLLLLAAALGGLILNLTPCVIPVIPVKVMGLSAAAGKSRARCLYLGIVTALGIIGFWICIGGAVAFTTSFKQVSQLFQFWWFTVGVGIFVALMAMGMMGLFTINLPAWVYKFMPQRRPASADGSRGGATWTTFLSGIFTAVLSTPCTAPFMGAATAWGATQRPAITLATFGAIGVGMAVPYVLLSAFPRWISKVPRSGPASHLVKQVMGLLLFAVAVFFLGTGIGTLISLPVDPPFRAFWWLVAALVLAAMILLVAKTFAITRSTPKRLFWTLAGLVISAGAFMLARDFTDRGPIPWIAYTPERFEQAIKDRKVIVIDFTAEYCLNCKALEIAVLHRPEVVAALASADVVPFRADIGINTAASDKLKSLQWVGIPLLTVSGPALAEPVKYDTYTPDTVLQAISKARGQAAAAPSARGRSARPPISLSSSQSADPGPVTGRMPPPAHRPTSAAGSSH